MGKGKVDKRIARVTLKVDADVLETLHFLKTMYKCKNLSDVIVKLIKNNNIETKIENKMLHDIFN